MRLIIEIATPAQDALGRKLKVGDKVFYVGSWNASGKKVARVVTEINGNKVVANEPVVHCECCGQRTSGSRSGNRPILDTNLIII